MGERSKSRRIVENSLVMVLDILTRTKSILLEWTDAGPGVSVTQKAVKYRAAQIVHILDLDYLIRLHLANNDSSHNEVERYQSYVGDAICDGGPLNWEYKKLFWPIFGQNVLCALFVYGTNYTNKQMVFSHILSHSLNYSSKYFPVISSSGVSFTMS